LSELGPPKRLKPNLELELGLELEQNVRIDVLVEAHHHGLADA
jgi:hypothetical protein